MSLHTDTGIIAIHPHRRGRLRSVTVSVTDNDGRECSVELQHRDVGTITSAMRVAVGWPLRKLAL